jgi:hypothetical protein
MMMRGAPCLLVAALVVTIATPAAAASFGELLTWCGPPDQGGRPELCHSYLDSGLELLASPDKSLNDGLRACVPKGEDRAEVVSLLWAYARAHPAAHSLDFVDGLGLVLKERYPCR